ncbi:hypothetical protein ACLOJK_021084 [Asimina triloba]
MVSQFLKMGIACFFVVLLSVRRLGISVRVFCPLGHEFGGADLGLSWKIRKAPSFPSMGISFSCPFADHDDLDKDIETLVVRSISFKGDDVKKTLLRSVSFNSRDSEPTILRSLGSGKMIIQGSVSFKRRESDPFHLETMISIETPPLPKENALVSPGFKSKDITHLNPPSISAVNASPSLPRLELGSPTHEAAVKLQKVYKSFRTRRQLADCAVLVEQRWWKLLDFAVLKRSSVSFFDIGKPETAVSRWSRARTRAAKVMIVRSLGKPIEELILASADLYDLLLQVGKGLSKDQKARKLALQHWLEAVCIAFEKFPLNFHPCLSIHAIVMEVTFITIMIPGSIVRVGSHSFTGKLDVGEGREANLVDQCPRSKLQQQCIKYLGPKEREIYEIIVEDGKLVCKQSGKLLDTTEGPKHLKWIFVLSTSKNLYVGQKKKGKFQHSSFLAGGATSAAGRLVAEQGILKAVWPHSGHYKPTEENFQEFMTFLKEHNVDLTDVKVRSEFDYYIVMCSPTDEDEEYGSKHGGHNRNNSEVDLGIEISDLAVDDTSAKQEGFTSDQSPDLESTISSNSSTLKCIDLSDGRETVSQAMGNTSTVSQLGNNEMAEESSTSEQHYIFHKRNLFERDQEESEEEEVPHELILRRINSKKGMNSLQLGKQLSCKWTTGAGPRIGWVRDYPSELQFRALEQVNLSPRSDGNLRAYASPRSVASPQPRTPTASLLRENSNDDYNN